jgi:hypothetical protein
LTLSLAGINLHHDLNLSIRTVFFFSLSHHKNRISSFLGVAMDEKERKCSSRWF